MSRRDFELIARVFAEHWEAFASMRSAAALAGWMADALASTNPRFDRARFIEACRPGWVVGTRHEGPWDHQISSRS